MIDVTPATAVIGAEVRGVDLREQLSGDDVATIRRALLEHLVLFFRDQDLDDESHLAFALRFGPLSIPPLATRFQDRPSVTVLDQVAPRGQGADEWHSDNTFMAHPPMGSILRCVQLPTVGGDTCFASMYAAYEGLSEPLRLLVDSLDAEHDITKPLVKAIRDGNSTQDLADMQQRWPPVVHPVAREHPETGRKALFVNRNSTTRILGVTERESEVLLPFLCDHARSPDFQVRLHWEPGTVAFWDNRSVQHYAVPDYAERRVMHRVTIDASA